MRGHITIHNSFDAIDLVQEVFSSQHPVVAKKTDYYHVGTELERGTITKVGSVTLPIGDYKEMGFRMKLNKRGIPHIKVAYQIEIVRMGMLSMLRFIVPYGGHFPDTTDPFIYGQNAKTVVFHLTELEAIQARRGDKDIVMAGS